MVSEANVPVRRYRFDEHRVRALFYLVLVPAMIAAILVLGYFDHRQQNRQADVVQQRFCDVTAAFIGSNVVLLDQNVDLADTTVSQRRQESAAIGALLTSSNTRANEVLGLGPAVRAYLRAVLDLNAALNVQTMRQASRFAEAAQRGRELRGRLACE